MARLIPRSGVPSSGRPASATVLLLAIAATILSVASCRHDRSLERLRRGEGQEGQASWYGPGFDGKRTANGERYEMNGKSAAHRTLPFGTLVRVTRLDSGSAVIVRVNDRGPFVKDRVIDLSLGAARAIGLDRDGVARVFLSVERWPEEEVAAVYTVQVGAFREEDNAQRLRRDLARRFDDVHVQDWYEYHRVRVGLYPSEEQADEASERLAGEGFTPFVTREN